MKLNYKNRKLEKSVASLSAISANYGTRAKLVNQRKNELQAAPSLETMRNIPAANCHELKSNLKGKLAVDISGNHRIIFEPTLAPAPTKEDGGLDWKQVTEITILVIGVDYH
ncbi:MAG: killer suppression protein HigA [Bacteroidetes bacterium GWA2_30_7]|nr:MAG: killer suppression protein HigA [Bacteroidetes bacterium GWA2_30_7]